MGIKEKIDKEIKRVGFITKKRIFELTGSTNGGEYISRLRRDGRDYPCVMATNAKTMKKYGIYINKGKK